MVEGLLTGGHVADITVADELTAQVVGCAVVEDRGYDCDRHRAHLRSNNNLPVIPARKTRKGVIDYDHTLYRLRRHIELFFGKLKENRRLALRFDKHDSAFLGFIALAAIKIAIRSNL